MSEERSDETNRTVTLNNAGAIRQSLMLRTFQVGLALLIPLLGFGIITLYRSDYLWLIPLPIIALILLGIGATRRLRGHIIRAWIITGILFGFGVLDLVLFGWRSDARLFLLSSILIASLLISNRTGYGFWGGGIALTLGYIVINYTGWFKPFQGSIVDGFTLRVLREWIVYVCLGGGLAAAINYGLTKLWNALDEVKARSDALQDERELVTVRTATLQQLTNDLQKREKILDASALVTRSLIAIQPLRSLLAFTVDLIAQYFGFEHAGIYLMDETEGWLVLHAASSAAGKKLLAQGFSLRVDETSVVGWVATNLNVKCVDFDGEDAETKTSSRFAALRAELAIPILIDGDIVGVIDIQASKPTAFNDYAIDAMQNLALEFALVMSTTRRLDGMPLMDIAQPFYKAGQRIVSARTDIAVYEAAVEVLVGYNASRLTFVRKQDESNQFYTAFDMKNGQISFSRHSVDSPNFALLSVLAQYGSRLPKPVWLENNKLDALELPEQLYEMVLNSQEVDSVAIVPAFASDSLIGVFIILFDNPHEFSQIEMRLHRLVAGLTALAIERNALIEDVTTRTAQERILGGVRSRLRSSLDPDVILRTTIQELGQLLGAELTVVELAGSENRSRSAG